MAVTSEPPWLNIATGTAARNGTTSHTINFGFTSTSGSLLVAFIHGAVTHAATGWTKQAGPVATGECALLTKTSAGDSSITVTHNGSNYPVNYVIYEFPTGSSQTGVDSTTGSNDTLVGLTGLPGTAQVVIAAIGRVAIGAETTASATWTAPLVEDVDLFAAASGTDGSYLTVGHELNVTTTSSTPTTSISYTGTWSNAQREKISVAFDVAVAAAGHTRTVDDPAGLADAATTAAAVSRSVSDSAGHTDTTTRAFGKEITEVTGLVDTTTRASGHVRTQTDAAGTVDTVARAAGFTRTQNDGAGLTDAVTQQLFTLITRTVDDDAGLRDGDAAQALDIAETVTDGAGLTDSATPVLTPSGGALTRTVDDPAGLVDGTTKASVHARTQDDNSGTVDAASTQLAGARQADDTTGLTDSVTYSSTQTLTDGTGLTDTATHSLTAARPVTDSLGLVDGIAWTVTAARAATDGLGLTDSVTAQLNASTAHTRTITDSAGLTSAHRCKRLTRRPNSGTTYRPNSGTTQRYALIPD